MLLTRKSLIMMRKTKNYGVTRVTSVTALKIKGLFGYTLKNCGVTCVTETLKSYTVTRLHLRGVTA